MAEGILPRSGLITIVPFQIAVRSGGGITGTRASGQGPTAFTPAVFVVIRADDANSATINWGWGNNASDPLAKGETVAFDLPFGYYCDLSQICVNGTAADSIHVVAGVLEGLPGV